MEIGPGPKNYIKAIRMLYDKNPNGKAYYDFILANAVEKRKDALTTAEQENLHHILSSRFPAKQCYKNAQTLAICNDEIDYVEGWVDSGLPIQIEHAWNEYNGKIIDVTLVLRSEKELKKIIPSEHANRLSKEDEETKRFDKAVYYGIKIPKKFLEEKLLETDMHWSFLGQFYFTCVQPLQKGKKPPKNCGTLSGYKWGDEK